MAQISSEEKEKIERTIKEVLEENKLWKTAWGMIFGTVFMGFFISLLLAWPIAWLWNHSAYLLYAPLQPMTFWKAFFFSYMVRLMWPMSYRYRR